MRANHHIMLLLSRFSLSPLFSFQGTSKQISPIRTISVIYYLFTVIYPSVGVNCGEGPPVPFPNTAVKLANAENTWLETAREDKSAPTQERRDTQSVAALLPYRYRAPSKTFPIC